MFIFVFKCRVALNLLTYMVKVRGVVLRSIIGIIWIWNIQITTSMAEISTELEIVRLFGAVLHLITCNVRIRTFGRIQPSCNYHNNRRTSCDDI